MKNLEFDPRRLDVRAFAKAGAELTGSWPLAGFARLCPALVAADDGAVAGAVRWTLRGEERAERAGARQAWLHLQAQAELAMACQRCLAPTLEAIELERSFQFVADEASAAALDAEAEHDVLVLPRTLDLHALLEDELLLDLPLVPRHASCPQPLAEPATAPDPTSAPFAVLARLRRPPS